MTETMLTRMARAIAEASKKNWFCLYDYSAYPEADLKPHVVRNESDGRVVFESDSPREAREFYEAKEQEAVAKAALEAIRDGGEEVFAELDMACTDRAQSEAVWRNSLSAILQGEA